MSSNRKFTIRELVFISIMSAVVAVCSWISIPSVVPFTLQTLAVFCSLSILGGRSGFFAILVYILLGTVGFPVFSGFKGGISILIGPTGGYIIGFLMIAGMYWIGEVLSNGNSIVNVISMTVGLMLCYTFGTLWFMFMYTRSIEKIGWFEALKLCISPFVIPDLFKMLFAISISNRIKKHVNLHTC